MYILPYVEKPLQTSAFNSSILWLFLTNGGTILWKTDEETISEEEVVQQYLTENGFRGESKGILNDCLYFQVDPSCMKEFYSWIDCLEQERPFTDLDLWRPFLLLKDEEYGWKIQADTLRLEGGAFQSLGDLLVGLRRVQESI